VLTGTGFYLHLSYFYSVLLNKMSVIVYIVVSEIADPRPKLPYTAMVFSAHAGRERDAQGDSGPSGLADPGDYVGESAARPYPLVQLA
jgi:hypothetical protein